MKENAVHPFSQVFLTVCVLHVPLMTGKEVGMSLYFAAVEHRLGCREAK